MSWTAVILASAGVVTALGALLVAGRKVWRGVRRAGALVRQVGRDAAVLRDTLIGSDPIMHPIREDEVLLPGKPGLAKRMDTIETTLTELVSTNRRMDALETDVVNLRAEVQAGHGDLARRVSSLEDNVVERTVTRAESAAMWTAIAAEATGAQSPEQPAPIDNPDLG